MELEGVTEAFELKYGITDEIVDDYYNKFISTRYGNYLDYAILPVDYKHFHVCFVRDCSRSTLNIHLKGEKSGVFEVSLKELPPLSLSELSTVFKAVLECADVIQTQNPLAKYIPSFIVQDYKVNLPDCTLTDLQKTIVIRNFIRPFLDIPYKIDTHINENTYTTCIRRAGGNYLVRKKQNTYAV